MIPRAQVEQVLRKWIPRGLIAESGPIPIIKEDVIDDLCALPCAHPTPSREMLEKLLAEVCHVQNFQLLVDKILAWAGQEPRNWCEHIHADPNDSDLWVLVAEGFTHWQDNKKVWNWKFCPVCGAPRPSEA